MPLRLVCTDGSLDNGPPYLVPGQAYRIGRSSKSAFIVNDLSVSRKHAELIAGKSVVTITDVGSRNGTYLDNAQIKSGESGLVHPGQTIFFANARFILTETDDNANDSFEMSEFSTAIVRIKPRLLPDMADVLTKAEKRVLDQVLDGFGEKEIAEKLFLSQHTVHDHVKAIYRKLKVKSRPELLMLFWPAGNQPPAPRGGANGRRPHQ